MKNNELYCILLYLNINASYWEVLFPDFPGLFGGGANITDAIENAKNGLTLHVEGLILANENIPSPKTIDEIIKDYKIKNFLIRFIEIDKKNIEGKVK